MVLFVLHCPRRANATQEPGVTDAERPAAKRSGVPGPGTTWSDAVRMTVPFALGWKKGDARQPETHKQSQKADRHERYTCTEMYPESQNRHFTAATWMRYPAAKIAREAPKAQPQPAEEADPPGCHK